MTEQTKKCSRCHNEKPLSEFHKDRGEKLGVVSQCKECKKELYKGEQKDHRRAYAKRYREEHREKLRAQDAAYNRSHKEQMRAWRLRRRYGISLGTYEEMFEAQSGLCKVCGKKSHGKRLAVDHDHKTGEIRALLCHSCNTAVGYMEDDSELLRALADYIESYRTPNKKEA